MDEIRRLIREVDPPRPSTRLKTLDGAEITTAAKRRHTEPAKLSGALRGDLDWIVMKCLEKDRARRYDTANGLALDLQRHLKNEVVVARPPTAGYLLGKLIRRNKLVFAAGTLVTATLILGIAISTSQAIRATRAEREQVRQRIGAERAREREAKLRQQAEVRERIAGARALLDRGQLDEANSEMGNLSVSAIEPTLANTEHILFFAKWNVIRGHSQEAIEAYQIFFRVDPSGGDVETTTMAYLQLACLLIEVGDDIQVRTIAQGRFGPVRAHGGYILAYRIAQMALLRPASTKLCDKIGILVRRVEGYTMVGAGGSWQEFLGALFEFRRRNHLAVIQRCNKTLSSLPESRCAAATFALLAASEQSVDHPAEARVAVANCQTLLDSEPDARNPPNVYWFDWRFARLFLREAQGLIEGKSSVQPTKP